MAARSCGDKNRCAAARSCRIRNTNPTRNRSDRNLEEVILLSVSLAPVRSFSLQLEDFDYHFLTSHLLFLEFFSKSFDKAPTEPIRSSIWYIGTCHPSYWTDSCRLSKIDQKRGQGALLSCPEVFGLAIFTPEGLQH